MRPVKITQLRLEKNQTLSKKSTSNYPVLKIDQSFSLFLRLLYFTWLYRGPHEKHHFSGGLYFELSKRPVWLVHGHEGRERGKAYYCRQLILNITQRSYNSKYNDLLASSIIHKMKV